MVHRARHGLAAIMLGALVVASGCVTPRGAGTGTGTTSTTAAPFVPGEPDCDVDRPAVPFRFGGLAVEPAPAGSAPVPCVQDLGPTSESAVVGVTARGEVAAGPLLAAADLPVSTRLAGPARVSVSDDRGVTWRSSTAGEAGHGILIPPWLSADPRMERIWFATIQPDLCGTQLSWSDDGGRGWDTNPDVGCPGLGTLKVLEGPAPRGTAAPTGYGHVVYVCANAADIRASSLHCYKSRDGGRSFTPIGAFPDRPVPAGCETRHPARPGTVTAEGVLVFPVYLCGEISVAVSADEGETWQWHHVHDGDVQELHHSSTAADEAGNVYLAWLAGDPANPAGGAAASPFAGDAIQGRGIPVVSMSRDGGVTWTPPQPVAPPGVSVAQRIALSARGSGQVTVSFLGSSDGGDAYHGYVVVSDDVLAPEPLWWGAAVNDPDRPLARGPLEGHSGDRLFFFNNALGPDGTPWAAFHCVEVPGCSSSRSLVVGRLDR